MQYNKRALMIFQNLLVFMFQAWRETYTNIIDPGFLEQMTPTQERWKTQWPHSITVIAVDKNNSDSVVGFATIGKRRSTADCSPAIQEALEDINGELYAIYVLKKAHRQGLATKMFALASQLATQQFSLTKLRCWVLTANSKNTSRGYG